jgi:hypothetical protein
MELVIATMDSLMTGTPLFAGLARLSILIVQHVLTLKTHQRPLRNTGQYFHLQHGQPASNRITNAPYVSLRTL